MNIKPKIEKKCSICGLVFYVSPSRATGQHERKVCGLECSGVLTSRRKHPMLGKHHSLESKEKNRLAHIGQKAWNRGLKGYMAGEQHHWFGLNRSGENNPTYIKDRTKLKKTDREYSNSAYMNWMKAVKNRDGWKCRIADKNCSGRLESHHILPWRDYPELRYEINNGITLCRHHHPRKREEEERLSPYFKEIINNTKPL
jgi:hypothetical protein